MALSMFWCAQVVEVRLQRFAVALHQIQVVAAALNWWADAKRKGLRVTGSNSRMRFWSRKCCNGIHALELNHLQFTKILGSLGLRDCGHFRQFMAPGT